MRAQAVQRGVADAAPGLVHDPPQRHLVGGVVQHLQVGDQILHLGPLVELGPTHHPVVDALAGEQILQHPRLGVHAVEDGDLAGIGAVVERRLDAAGHVPGFGVLVLGLDHPHHVARAEVRPQPLRLAITIVLDHAVRGVQDRLGRAVVLLERDHDGVREVLLELADVADVGAAEGVDRLILVAHHRQVAVLLGQDRDQLELGVVGVLVLVDHHVAEGLLPVAPRLGHPLEQQHGLHDQVVEVHRVGLRQPPLVEVIDRGHRLLEEATHLLPVQLGGQQPVLGVGDGAVHRPRHEPLGILPEVLDAALHQPHLVGLVVDREVRPVPDQLGVAAQHAAAGGVERHHPHAGGDAAAHQLLHALLHLGRGAVGEGDRKHLGGRGQLLLDQVGDAVRQHARLAGTGPCHHQQRAFRAEHRLALLRVQGLQRGRGRRHQPALVSGAAAAEARVTKGF